MKAFALHDAAGVIRQLATGAKPPASAGLEVAEVDAGINPRDWWVRSGVLVAYTAEQKRSLLQKPNRQATWDNTAMTWVDGRPQAQKDAQEWMRVREKRATLLEATDVLVLRAAEAAVPLSTAWRTYRQALRDITLQPDPFKVVWPAPP